MKIKVNEHQTINIVCDKVALYLVGKVEIQDCFGTGKLLLYKIFREKSDAEEYIKKYINKYYKQKPYLCPLTIKKIEI